MRSHYVWSPTSQAKRRRRRHKERVASFRIVEMLTSIHSAFVSSACQDSVIYGRGVFDVVKDVSVMNAALAVVRGRSR